MKKTLIPVIALIAASAFAGPDTLRDASLVDDMQGEGGHGLVGHHAKTTYGQDPKNKGTGAVPEPATMAALAVGAGALLRRRAKR